MRSWCCLQNLFFAFLLHIWCTHITWCHASFWHIEQSCIGLPAHNQNEWSNCCQNYLFGNGHESQEGRGAHIVAACCHLLVYCTFNSFHQGKVMMKTAMDFFLWTVFFSLALNNLTALMIIGFTQTYCLGNHDEAGRRKPAANINGMRLLFFVVSIVSSFFRVREGLT
jgi:hypothetical protein